MKKLLLFVLLLAQFALFAQNADLMPGFYIAEKGDTVRGFFDVSEVNKNYVNFSKTNTEGLKFQKLYPYDVQKIQGKTNLCILSKLIEVNGEKEFIFLDQLTFSEIHLYKGVSKIADEVFYLNTVDRPDLVKIPKKAFEPFFKTYFYGCSAFPRPEYNEASLINVIAFFQKCQYKTELKKNQKRSKLQFSYGENMIIDYGQPRSARGYYFDYTLKIIPGFVIRMKMGDKVAFQSGVGFSYISFTPPNIATRSFTYVHLPLLLHFENKPAKKVSPIFAAGVLFNKSFSRNQRTINGNGTPIFKPYNSGSFLINGGFRFKMKNNQTFEISANFMWEVLSFELYELDTNYFGLTTAYIFPSKKGK
jgi:hypothetical protein